MEEARAQIQYGLSQCDLLKISEEELEFVTGTTDVIRGAKQLKKQYPNIRLMNCDDGKRRKYGISSGQTSILQTVFTERND